jgi:ATP phosphoribosyltransferase regulatory subunit
MRPVTPRGYRDVLALEAAERDALVARMSACLDSWGYEYVETPVVENVATLEAATGGPLSSDVFRLFDSDGSLLALRPEMTVPIARLVATRLDGTAGPHRLRYSGRVFRDQPSLQGQPREFMQVGVELVGSNGPASDAEVIGLMADALESAGLREYTVGVGTVAVLRALIEAAEMNADWNSQVYASAHDRNLVAIGELAETPGVPADVSTALKIVPGLRGGREAIEQCREAAGEWAGAALDDLAATWDLLAVHGCAERVSIDFGIMRSFDYYTGIVLEAYGSGPGLALGGGGRYDGVLAAFDSPAPAAGFALRVERVHEALAAQDVDIPASAIDVVVGGDAEQAFPAAAGLRQRGLRVRLAPDADAAQVRDMATQVGAVYALLADPGRLLDVRTDGESHELDLDALPATTESGGVNA